MSSTTIFPVVGCTNAIADFMRDAWKAAADAVGGTLDVRFAMWWCDRETPSERRRRKRRARYNRGRIGVRPRRRGGR